MLSVKIHRDPTPRSLTQTQNFQLIHRSHISHTHAYRRAVRGYIFPVPASVLPDHISLKSSLPKENLPYI